MEPCVCLLPDGRTRLWYECRDATYFRAGGVGPGTGAVETFAILSATTPAPAAAAAAL